MSDTPKFRRRADARPDEVLDAALALFGEKGFAATTVDDIARRAGLSKGGVYLYFPSKKALLEGLVRRAILPTANEAFAIAEHYRGDPIPVIERFLRTLAATLSGGSAFRILRLILQESATAPGIAQMYRDEILDRGLAVMGRLIAQGIENGHLRPVDPEMTVRSVMGPLIAHLLLAEIFGVTPADGLAMDRLIDNHLDILKAGLAVERPR
jgi:AcrR family transcriptional regulator